MTPRRLLWAALILTLISIGPILSVAVASGIASQFGCALDEGSVHPCIIAGRDWGDTLYAMGVMGWLMLLTIWLVPVALVLWVVWLVARFRARRG